MQGVQSRRDVLIGTALMGSALVLSRSLRAQMQAERVTLRPAPEQRTFSSPAVEETLQRVKSKVGDAGV